MSFFTFQRKHYVKYAKVFPLASLFDIKIPSKWYRRVIGGLEVICGICLAAIPHRKFGYVYRNVRNFNGNFFFYRQNKKCR